MMSTPHTPFHEKKTKNEKKNYYHEKMTRGLQKRSFGKVFFASVLKLKKKTKKREGLQFDVAKVTLSTGLFKGTIVVLKF